MVGLGDCMGYWRSNTGWPCTRQASYLLYYILASGLFFFLPYFLGKGNLVKELFTYLLGCSERSIVCASLLKLCVSATLQE